jgi:phage shock protein E
VIAFLAAAAFVWWMFRAREVPSDEQVKVLLDRGATVLDVRSPGEFAASHHPSARNIPVDELGLRLSDLDKDKPVIVYCASGMRSRRATGILRAAGFEAVDVGTVRGLPR